MARYLLATGILLGLVWNAPWARRAAETFRLDDINNIAFTSVICKGEILALAEMRRWGARKKEKLEGILDETPALGINTHEIISGYALIKAWTQGKSVVNSKNIPPPIPARPMATNDLWVAATAFRSEAILLSTGKDFEHLDGVWLDFQYVSQHGQD